MHGSISAQAFSELIGSIYDCALDPARWDRTLIEIAQAFGAMTAILSLSDLRENRLLVYRQTGIEPHFEALLQKHQAEVNAALGRNLAIWPSLDTPYLLSRHTTEEERAASPYIQECVKPGGVADIMQYFLMHTPARFSGIAVTRHERVGAFTDAEIELGALLLPHLRRAVTISNVLDARAFEQSQMKQMFDVLQCGVVLVDSRGVIVYANRAAERMLESGDPVHAVQGILQPKPEAAAKEMRSAIRMAAEGGAGIGKAGLAILLTEGGESPAFAHILPMTSGSSGTKLRPDAAAAVFISGAPKAQDVVEVVAGAFGLTHAEQRVLERLLAGRTLTETAGDLGVAVTTAKTHLENIFAKTGVSRQADLMRLAATAFPPAKG